MYSPMTEKIKIVMIKRDIKIPDLAKMLGVTKQNVWAKFNKNNLSEKDILEIAKALNCTFEGVFTLNESQEKV